MYVEKFHCLLVLLSFFILWALLKCMHTLCHTFAKLAQKHEKYLYTVLILLKIFCIILFFSAETQFFTFLCVDATLQSANPKDFSHPQFHPFRQNRLFPAYIAAQAHYRLCAFRKSYAALRPPI